MLETELEGSELQEVKRRKPQLELSFAETELGAQLERWKPQKKLSFSELKLGAKLEELKVETIEAFLPEKSLALFSLEAFLPNPLFS